jgi:hypothetical protein
MARMSNTVQPILRIFRALTLSLTLYLGVATVGGKDAFAAFSQLTCPTSYSWGVNFKIDGYQYDLQAPYYDQYQDNQTTPWTEIITNSNVAGINPYLSYFMVETNYDYFEFNDATGYPKYTGYLNGTFDLIQGPTALQTISHTGYRDIWYQWYSDYDTHFTPPTMSTALVACGGSQTTTATNARNLGSTGNSVEVLLIGTGDTVYATFTQPANSKGLVILTHKSSGDADLYVSSTNSTPDDSSFTYRSMATGDDAIALPQTSTQKTWYVGVHSYAGSEHVVLDVNFQKPSAYIPMKVYTEFQPTADDQNYIRTFLQSGALRMLSATDGGLMLGPYDVYYNGGVSCSTGAGVCLSNSQLWFASASVTNNCKDANAVFCQGMWHGNWDLAFVHEMGHGCFGFDEEYRASDVARLCGHSEMNSAGTSSYGTATAGYCSRRHCLDGDAYDATICNSNVISNWTWMKQQTSIPLTWAGDWGASGMDPRRTNYTNNSPLAGMVPVTFH